MNFPKNSGKVALEIFGIVGVLATLYSLFFIKTRQPVFYVNQRDWVTLIDRDQVDQASIKVLDKNDEVTTGNIVAARFYFWNDGKESIKFEENVLAYGDDRKQEITIQLEGDPNVRILDFSCPAIPRQEVINFRLTSEGEQALKLNFDILEHKDGAACQIIFESSEEVNLAIYGAIEGKKGFLEKGNWRLISLSWRAIAVLSSTLLLLICLYIDEKIKGDKTDENSFIRAVEPYSFYLICSSLVLLFIFAAVIPPKDATGIPQEIIELEQQERLGE